MWLLEKILEKQLIVEIEGLNFKFLYGKDLFVHGLNLMNMGPNRNENLLACPRYRDTAHQIGFSRVAKIRRA
jgi:hypothetical protein